MKFKDRNKHSMPREKLKAKGVEALSDFELLMAIIGSGNAQADVSKIAKDTQKLINNKSSSLTFDDLLSVKCLGPAKATQIIAGFELWRRQFEVSDRPVIDSSEKAFSLLSDICDKKQEYFICITLDGASRLIAKRVISIGTLTSSLVHPREVFADAITDRAASIIVAHNHPSGDLRPSTADIGITDRLREAASLLGMNLTHHLLVAGNRYTTIG